MGQITLNGVQYLTLRALCAAASSDKSRQALTRLFYDHAHDRFVATDGHILRCETIRWECEPPECSFLLAKSAVMLTRAQLKLQHGDAKNSEQPIQDIFIPIDFEEYGNDKDMVYPSYMNVIPPATEAKDIGFVGFNPYLLARICKTFYTAPRALQFKFFGDLRTVLMFKGGEEADTPDFAGVVMPVRILWEKSHNMETKTA